MGYKYLVRRIDTPLVFFFIPYIKFCATIITELVPCSCVGLGRLYYMPHRHIVGLGDDRHLREYILICILKSLGAKPSRRLGCGIFCCGLNVLLGIYIFVDRLNYNNIMLVCAFIQPASIANMVMITSILLMYDI